MDVVCTACGVDLTGKSSAFVGAGRECMPCFDKRMAATRDEREAEMLVEGLTRASADVVRAERVLLEARNRLHELSRRHVALLLKPFTPKDPAP